MRAWQCLSQYFTRWPQRKTFLLAQCLYLCCFVHLLTSKCLIPCSLNHVWYSWHYRTLQNMLLLKLEYYWQQSVVLCTYAQNLHKTFNQHKWFGWFKDHRKIYYFILDLKSCIYKVTIIQRGGSIYMGDFQPFGACHQKLLRGNYIILT